MTEMEACREHAVVMQPDEGPSFWQPEAANGHSDPKLYPAITKFPGFSMGYQTIAPNSWVRAPGRSSSRWIFEHIQYFAL